MLLWSSTDLCYNLYGGLLVEAGNGIDDSQLLLKLLEQQAHILEDIGVKSMSLSHTVWSLDEKKPLVAASLIDEKELELLLRDNLEV